MAKAIMNCRVFLAECDLSGVTNAAALNLKADLKECSVFESTFKERLAGIPEVLGDISGYFEAQDPDSNPDKKMFDQLALNDAALSLLVGDGASGNQAYFFRPAVSQYSPLDGGKVGEMAAFKLHAEGAAPLVRGQVLLPKAARTVTGAGAALQLGAVAATQKVYCAVHIFAVSGTTPALNLVLQSDTTEAFTSPTDVITFSQKTAAGQDWQSANGPITDTWWRIAYTIGGTTPSFTCALVAGIV